MQTQTPTVQPQRTHARVSPSKLDPFSECSSYESAPSESEASKEGELLHEVIQKIIENWCKDPTVNFNEVSKMAYEVFKLHDEQRNSIDTCTKEFKDLLTKNSEEVFTEEKITVYDAAGEVITFGFADLVVITSNSTEGKIALIFDWKFGRNLVKPASVNKQGYAYVTGLLQSRKDITGVGMIFIQPRALEVSTAFFKRDQLSSLYEVLNSVIDKANATHQIIKDRGFEGLPPPLFPQVNSYCRFCARAGECPALIKASANAVAEYNNLPALRDIASGELSTPERVASALFIVKKLEPVIEAVKAKALQLAKEGYELESTVGGRQVKYELRTRASARSITSLPEAYETVKDVIPLSVVLGCASIKIGEFEDRYAEFRVEQAEKSGEPSPTGKKRFTKKDAVEELNKNLQEHELISGNGQEISYLKEVVVEYIEKEQKTKTTKTINI